MCLCRECLSLTKAFWQKGKYVFKKTESHYVGYALFTTGYLVNLRDRLRVYPVKAGERDHCGMFF